MEQNAPAAQSAVPAAIERLRPAPLAVEDGSRPQARGQESRPEFQDKEAVRAKLAVLRMKASLIKAHETQSAGSRPSSSKTSSCGVAAQTEVIGAASGSGDGLEVCAGQPSTARLGIALNLLDAIGPQDTALGLVRQAVGPVALLAYTLDREDLVTALVEARGRGLEVSVGVDRRFSWNGRCQKPGAVPSTAGSRGLHGEALGWSSVRELLPGGGQEPRRLGHCPFEDARR